MTNRTERLAPGTVLDSDEGPFTVARSRPFGDRWLVVFDGVTDRGRADALRGTVLRADAIDDPDALWVHELIGADVVRRGDGAVMGRVVAVRSNPASDLLELHSGALVPTRFVVSHGDGRVVVDVPDGLFD